MKVILGLFVASLAYAQIPTSGLQVAYAFTNGSGTTVSDSSGNGRDGLLGGSATPSPANDPVWIRGNGIDCGGITSLWGLSNWMKGPALSLASGPMSVAVLFSTTVDTSASFVNPLVDNFDTSSFVGFGLEIDATSTHKVEYWNGGAWSVGTVTVDDQVWHTAVVNVVSNTVTNLYIDGTLDSVFTVAYPTVYAGTLGVCSYSGGTNPTSSVQIGGVYIWNRALLTAEIMNVNTTLQAQVVAGLNEYATSPSVPFPPSFVTQPNNGLDNVPSMEWNDWYCYLTQTACGNGAANITESQFRAQCAELITLGLQSFTGGGGTYGYKTCDLTEPHTVARTPAGDFVSHWHPNKAATAAYVHGLGLKYGDYTATGKKTCQLAFGLWSNETSDAAAYKRAGVDEIQVDWCSAQTDYASQLTSYGQQDTMHAVYQYLNQQYVAAGYVPEYGVLHNYAVGLNFVSSVGGNYTRFGTDTVATWVGVQALITAAPMTNIIASPSQVGANHWPLCDILGVGDGMTDGQGRVEFALCSIIAAPLQISMDLTSITAGSLATIKNTWVLAVDQDHGAMPGYLVSSATCGSGVCQVWVRPLVSAGSGIWALALVNTDTAGHTITATWSSIATTLAGRTPSVTFGTGPYTKTYDLENNGMSLGTLATSYAPTVAAGDVAMAVISNATWRSGSITMVGPAKIVGAVTVPAGTL